MKRIRIGKDISMRWEITTDGVAIPLDGRDLTVEIKSPMGIENNIPYRVEGNILIMTYYGYEQKRTGEYSITLWEKKGKPGQNVVDVIRAFKLVETSQEEDDFVGGDLQIESVDLGTENFDILTEGGYRAINIDTLQAEALEDSVNINGKTYSNESFTITLPKANLDSAGVMGASDVRTLKEHADSIARIKTSCEENAADIERVSNVVDTHESRLGGIDAEISSLNTEVSTLQSKVDENTTSISQINNNIADNNKSIAQINTTLEEHTESINANITTDRIKDGAVTIGKLEHSIQSLITNISKNASFSGIATPTTNPGTPDGPVFYIANGKGTYTNFGGLQVTEDDVVVLTWDSSWHKMETGIALQDKLTELESEVFELNTSVGLDSSIEFISNSQNAKLDLPLKVGQIVTITNLASIDCSVYTFGDNGVVETIITPLSPNESIEYTIKKEASFIGGYIATAPYHIKIESKTDGLIKSVESLIKGHESLTKADFNNDGFLIRMGYDKGSNFIIGNSTSKLTLKCALYVSKSGTTYLKGFYNINTTISLDNSKFSFVVLNLNSGEILVSNADESIYDEGIVVLLTMTPTKHLTGHLAAWAYSQVYNAKATELYNKNKVSIDEIKTDIDGTVNITEFTSSEHNARFDFPLSVGQTIRITNQGSVACSASTFNDLGLVEIIQSPIAVGETVKFTATKSATKIGGYIDTLPYNIKVEISNNDGLSQRVKTIEEKQKQATGADIYFQFHGHPFYSHSLINLQNKSQIIPCMSIYDVNMAARLGFKFIEPSGAYTSDGVYLVNHTVAKTLDGVSKQVFAGGVKYKGTENPADDFAVNEKTADWIRENCCYYSKYVKYESFVPTLEEFCLACRQNNIGVFLSANRDSDIETALSVIGADNLVIYSSNIPKLIEWRQKYRFITMMYYDTTSASNYQLSVVKEKAKSIGKPLLYCLDIPLINGLSDDTLKEFVYSMHNDGYLVGTAACYYLQWEKIQRVIDLGFDVFGSDGEMNDFVGNTYRQIGDVDFSDFDLYGSYSTDGGDLILQNSAYIRGGDVNSEPKVNFLCKSLLRIKFTGTLRVWMAGSHSKNDCDVISDGTKYLTFSDFGIEKPLSFYLTSIGETRVHYIEFNGSVC